MTSNSPTTQGRGQLTLRRCEQAAKTTHSVPENRTNTPTTMDTANHNESTSYARVADERIGLDHQRVYSTKKRQRLIPYSIVSTVNYQCGRLLKDHSDITTVTETEITNVQLLSPSSPQRGHANNVYHQSKKRKQQKDQL